MARLLGLAVCAFLALTAPHAAANDLKVLSAGAFQPVVLALQTRFESAHPGVHLIVERGTAGELAQRLAKGEGFDVVIAPPANIQAWSQTGAVEKGSRADLAKVGIGVVVKAGAAKPDIGTVDAFRRALLGAESIAYIDPASGGSSGVYLSGLFQSWGIAAALAPKTRLKKGGNVADLVADGEAALGIHQISEILPVAGVDFVGPIPAAIQTYTIYSAAIGAKASDTDLAKDLIALLEGPEATTVLAQKGMQRP